MITGLDHVVVLLGDIEAGAKAYELLLGRAPSWRSQTDGAETVLFTLDNMTLELMAPAGASAAADGIRTVIKIWGEGLASLCFRVADVAKMHRRLDRLALKPDPIAEVERRAAALFGARLGLDMALDRSHQEWGQLMFFRCGDLIVEVVRRPVAGADQNRDKLWGLSWRVADIDATRARLVAAGIDVSEVRAGRKAGTRVMSVRSGACGIHTLLLERTARS